MAVKECGRWVDERSFGKAVVGSDFTQKTHSMGKVITGFWFGNLVGVT